jgi:LemA protein
MIAIIILALVVLLVIIAVVMFNNLVQLRNRVENAWAQIDVQLKRRFDLIPNLLETVKAYAAHEKGTLEAVVQARNSAISASSGGSASAAAAATADTALTASLRQVFALSEAYPDLKANQNFLALQEELSATEGKISYARQFYNDTVMKYNTKIEQFPTSILAGLKKMVHREYFQTDEASREVPKVQF